MYLQLKRLRKQAGYKTQKDFADALGIPERRYASWEREEVMMSLEQAYNVTALLGCTLDELVGREAPRSYMSPEERRLVDKYRLMDAPEREKLKGVADSFVIASEKDGPGSSRDVHGIGRDLARDANG